MKTPKTSFSALRKWISLQHYLGVVGESWIGFAYEAGGISLMFWRSCKVLFMAPLRVHETASQMYKIGVASFPLVSLTALFTGMVLALQSAYQLRIFSAVQFTSDLVSLSTVRELGPVLTGVVVAGRVGASIAAEIGTMKVTEQIDALQSLAMDPIRYLVVPRFVASVSMLFILSIYAMVIGILGGYGIAIFKLGISSHTYLSRAIDILVLKDIVTGLSKAFFFGMIISSVGCYYGFEAKGGAEGVGMATTKAVVTSIITIIAFDCFYTAMVHFLF